MLVQSRRTHLGHYLRAGHALWSRIKAIGEMFHATDTADYVVRRMDSAPHAIILLPSGGSNIRSSAQHETGRWSILVNLYV